jgi:hypothetical protein
MLAPVLTYPNFEKAFILHTDASNIGIEAILLQRYEDGEHSIAYASRVLKLDILSLKEKHWQLFLQLQNFDHTYMVNNSL